MAELRLPPDAYMPGGITIRHAVTFDQGLEEYTRLRRAANKRLDRFPGAGFADSRVYEYNRQHPFPRPSEISSPEQLSNELGNLRRFFRSPMSSVKGQQRLQNERIATLHEHGFTFVNKGNLRLFGEFMEFVRVNYAELHIKASPQVADMFKAAERKNIPPEQLLDDFKWWLENYQALDKSEDIAGSMSAVEWKKQIQKDKRNARRRRRYAEKKLAKQRS